MGLCVRSLRVRRYCPSPTRAAQRSALVSGGCDRLFMSTQLFALFLKVPKGLYRLSDRLLILPPYLPPSLRYAPTISSPFRRLAIGEQGSVVARRGRGAVASAKGVRQRLELHIGAASRAIGERREEPLVRLRFFSGASPQ